MIQDNQWVTKGLPSRRQVNWLGFIGSVLAMGVALVVLQFYLQWEPCNLCIFQRIVMIALAGVFLLAALHNPQSWGAKVYGALIGLTAGTGAAIAIRHIWIQHLPPDQVPECGAGLNYLLDTMPLAQVIQTVLKGSGDCAEVQLFLGLSIPMWALLAFLAFGLAGTVRNWMRA